MDEKQQSTSFDDVSVANGGKPLVHAQETTDRSSLGSSYRAFLTSGIRPKVEFSEAVYRTLDGRDDKQRTQAYNACRSVAWFVRHRISGKIRIASSRCNLRWCPLCIKTKRFIMRQSLIPWVKNANKPKFITFTLRHSDADLNFQIDSLYKFFRVLRKRPYWKKRITGGIWFFQIKKSESDNRWHPHLHVICEGRYIPQRELSSVWRDITSGSFVVDIRAVKDPKKAAEYVSRYATAPCALDSFSLDDAVTVVDALHSRRICGAFGTAKSIQLVPKKCPDADDWEYMCSVSQMFFGKNMESFWFREIYESWVQNRRCLSSPDRGSPGNNGNLLLVEEPSTYKQFVFEWSNFES